MKGRNKIKYLKSSLIILFLLFSYSSTFSQDNPIDNNLEIMFKLIDSSVTKINNELPAEENNIFLKLNLASDYNIFSNRIISAFKKTSRNILLDSEGSDFELQYSIPQTKVVYKDLIKRSFFGGYNVNREILLETDFLVVKNGIVRETDSFRSYSIDTISYDEISQMEIASFPFTKAEAPSEPFFSSLMEPAIAVGAAAVTVFLFFTIRSK